MRGSTHKVAKRNATKTHTLNASLKDFNISLSPGNKLPMTEQCGVSSLEKEVLSMKQRESLKLRESVNNAKGSSVTVGVHLVFLQPTV